MYILDKLTIVYINDFICLIKKHLMILKELINLIDLFLQYFCDIYEATELLFKVIPYL